MAVDIAKFLKWWRLETQTNPIEFNVVLPTIVNNDETEYNAITGPDAEGIPPWSFVAFYEPLYTQWGENVFAGDNFVSLNNRVSVLESGSPLARSFTNPSRSLNSVFQISTTRDAFVSYSVDIAASLTLLAGQTGTVFLEYANDSGFTSGVTEVARFANGNTGTLTIGLGLTQTATGTLTGMVPANKYVRLRTVNTTGTPTFTYRSAQEVLL